MRKLIMIEFKKMSIKKHLLQVMIANACMLGLILMTTYFNNTAGALQGLPSIRTITVIDTFVKAVFIVWQAILIANLIVEEFRSKTILILFTYPINRKKLIFSKLGIIFIITLASMVASQTFLSVVLYLLNGVAPFIAFEIAWFDASVMLLTTLTSIMLGMMPLYIGMQNKSTVATVASSLIIVGLTVSSGGEKGGLITMIPISLMLGVIGMSMAYASIRKMLSTDVIV